MRFALTLILAVLALAGGYFKWSSGSADRAIAAAIEGDVDTLCHEVRSGIAVDFRDEAGRTLLMYASESGQVEVVSALLDLGADANLVTATGWSALAVAVAAGHEPVVRQLLLAGADPAARVGSSFAIADIARMHGRSSMLAMLVAPDDAFELPCLPQTELPLRR